MASDISFTLAESAAYYAARIPQLQQPRGAKEWRTACPLHHGTGDNFAVDPATGRWFCHSECGEGGDPLAFEMRLSGADFLTAKAEVYRVVGRVESKNGTSNHVKPIWREVARYSYVDADGKALFEVIRQETGEGSNRKKKFLQCRRDGAGRVIWNVDAVKPVPYHLRQLLANSGKRVFIVEGEQCVEALEAWGAIATTNSGGSGKSRVFEPWAAPYFKDRFITILPDNDQPGRKHAWAVAAVLLPVARSVQVIELPEVPEDGGDVVDWITAGAKPEDLKRVIASTPALDPAGLAELRKRWNLDSDESHVAESAPGSDDVPESVVRNYPDPLQNAAYHGLAGELTRLIEPQTEADPAAIMIQFLVAFGNVIGRSAHFVVEADLHYMNLFVVLVGQTAKGRKGTSFGRVKALLKMLDPDWANTRIQSGLASGEGLIWAVRDQIRENVAVRDKGHVVRHEEVISDEGVTDKRILVMEPEFAKVLQVSERDSNTLSPTIREAWDTGNLQTMTKKSAARATGGHISINGQITKDELLRQLTDTAAGNGFANRFLWVCTRRSKLLPEGGGPIDFDPILDRLQASVVFAKNVGKMTRDEEARAIWIKVYPALSEGRPGLLGAVTSRSEAQAMRLACVYALLDCSAVVRAEHLLAALEVWRYCEDSAAFIFGDALGDAIADEILQELRQRPPGMTRNEIREYFGRNKSSAAIQRALDVLKGYGKAREERTREDGAQKRHTERWFASSVRG